MPCVPPSGGGGTCALGCDARGEFVEDVEDVPWAPPNAVAPGDAGGLVQLRGGWRVAIYVLPFCSSPVFGVDGSSTEESALLGGDMQPLDSKIRGLRLQVDCGPDARSRHGLWD